LQQRTHTWLVVFCLVFTATESIHEIHVKYTYKSVPEAKIKCEENEGQWVKK